jgi:NhaA family Na+:H+ antiporter
MRASPNGSRALQIGSIARMAKSRPEAREKASLADRLAAPFQRFLAIEAASTILLILATAIALVWANSRWHESYESLWKTYAGVSLGGWRLQLSLEHWVNDGLMVLFFFLVGMEIKHELVHGELSTRERAMLPIAGALGGMIVPAGIYLLFHAGGVAASGWGIPMATDIAFAVAALTVLGSRVPSGLKVFLLALAIVDDLGAVSVIAVFYSHGLSMVMLGAAVAGLVLTYALNLAGVRSYGVYWIVGIAVWGATLASGIHATVAGVLLGFMTPAERLGRDDALSPLQYLTSALHPWVAFVIMPLFALANAGVRLEADALADPVASRVMIAVALGLVLGKPLGITLVSWLAVRLGIAALPQGVSWGAILGAGVLAGIGFTMALFITALAFEDAVLVAASKVGILGASVVATVVGLALLGRVLPARSAPGGSV